MKSVEKEIAEKMLNELDECGAIIGEIMAKYPIDKVDIFAGEKERMVKKVMVKLPDYIKDKLTSLKEFCAGENYPLDMFLMDALVVGLLNVVKEIADMKEEYCRKILLKDEIDDGEVDSKGGNA